MLLEFALGRQSPRAYQGIPFLSALWVFVFKRHLVHFSLEGVWKARARAASSVPQTGGGAVRDAPTSRPWLHTAHPGCSQGEPVPPGLPTPG